MRRFGLAAALLLVGGLWLGSAQALPADKHVTLEADNGQGCASQAKNDCYRVAEGSLDGFEQGMRVHVTLENVGSAPHNVYVTTSSQADSNHVDTPASAAINNSATIDPGATTNMTFEVPTDADGLYFWCDVDTHEVLGMWLNTSVAEATNDTDGSGGGQDGGANDSTDGGMGGDGSGTDDGTGSQEDESAIPSPGALLATAAAVGAALVGQRRRGS